MKIGDIDKNLKISDNTVPERAVWLDAKAEPFKLYGVFYDKENSHYARMPRNIASSVSNGVEVLSFHTSGGRIRFKTDSPYIAIKAVMDNSQPMPHITLTGQSGFDLFVRDENGFDRYCSTFIPPFGMTKGYTSLYSVRQRYYGSYLNYTGKVLEYTINFPLYDEVKELYIALDKDAVLTESDGYCDLKPMVFYGSSITQGGCASRPGNSYPAMISRALNIDFINLGFSGSCLGESAMADYISTLDMSVFICDYDHNSHSPAHTRETLPALYEKIRKSHPTLPFIFVSNTDAKLHPSIFIPRKEAVLEAYNKAVSTGDKNVYFVDGTNLFGNDCWDLCTVDGCHPNDLGFYRMAEGISKTIKEALYL